MPKHLIYDDSIKSVFISGAANPINPDTNENWASAEEAAEWIAAYPVPVEPVVLTLVTVQVRNSDGVVDVQQPFNLVVLTEGDAAEVDIEIQDGRGNVIVNPELDMTFTLPIIGLFSSPMKVVDVVFIDGKATASVPFLAQGMWRVDEAQVNMHIANREDHFVFKGLEFKVKQTTV
jgi:hypothetical protein